MEDYLKATLLCDVNDENIRNKANELTKDTTDEKDAAQKIFYFVRDEIPFGVGPVDTKASETLKKAIGCGVTRTNLQVAMLRTLGIPARYHHAVISKGCLKGIISDGIYKKFPEKVWFYPWCECYLGNKWVSSDILYDKKLYDASVQKGIIKRDRVPTIDWDGNRDLGLVKPWIIEDKGTLSSFDDVMRKVESENKLPKFITKIAYSSSNRYTNKLRKKE